MKEVYKLYKSELDVPVALIFFVRPETLKLVFEKVKKARPSKLFLIQDGARTNADLQKMQQCREIVEEIDWECDVYKNYSEVNMGSGERPYTGISWVFEHVEKAIILEDDCVPTDSFFSFCAEMLERYRSDLRIGLISGFNYFNEFDFGGYSYGFVKSGGIWGWATWKDRWDKYEFELSSIEDEYVRKIVEKDITPRFAAKKRLKVWDNAKLKLDKKEYVSYWDYQWGFTRHINSWLTIVPKYCQISNIGVGTGSTHSGNSIKMLSKGIARFFFMKVKDLEFPLKHPNFIIPDRTYDAKYYKIIYPNYFVKIYRRISRLLKKLFLR